MSIDFRRGSSMSVQSGAYFEGEAAGILQTLETLQPGMSRDQLKVAYKQLLIKLKKNPATAEGWVNFFFSEDV